MWYSLAKRQDFYAKKVNRFISMASCYIPEPYPYIPVDYEGLVALFLKIEELGIFNVNGADASSKNLFDMFCIVLEIPLLCLSIDAAYFFGYDRNLGAQSIGSFLYYA